MVRLAGSNQPRQLAQHDDFIQTLLHYRFHAEIIAHAAWIYYSFRLNLSDSELMLAERGGMVSFESIGEWGLLFDRLFANVVKWQSSLAFRLQAAEGLTLPLWLIVAIDFGLLLHVKMAQHG